MQAVSDPTARATSIHTLLATTVAALPNVFKIHKTIDPTIPGNTPAADIPIVLYVC